MVKVRIGYIAKDRCSCHKAESYYHLGSRGSMLSGNRQGQRKPRQSHYPFWNAHLNQAADDIKEESQCPLILKSWAVPRDTLQLVIHQPHCILNGKKKFHQFSISSSSPKLVPESDMCGKWPRIDRIAKEPSVHYIDTRYCQDRRNTRTSSNGA